MTRAGKEEALVSVIIPVYKIEDYLDACVQSVLRQTGIWRLSWWTTGLLTGALRCATLMPKRIEGSG